MVKKMAPGLSVAHATTADSAVNAQNAAVAGSVGGIQAGKFRQQVASDGPAVGLVNFAGLGLVVSCPGGYPKIYASGDGKVRFFSIDQDYGTYSNGSPDLAAFGSQGLSVLDPSAFDFGSGTIEWGTKNGATASFFFAYRWEDDTCDFFGNVLGG